jgi:hypothetical protein
MRHFIPLLLQAQTNTGDTYTPDNVQTLIDNYAQTADQVKEINQGWVNYWQCIFAPNTPECIANITLYPFLSQIALVIAVGSLLFFAIQFARDLNEGNFSKGLPDMMWPMPCWCSVAHNRLSAKLRPKHARLLQALGDNARKQPLNL